MLGEAIAQCRLVNGKRTYSRALRVRIVEYVLQQPAAQQPKLSEILGMPQGTLKRWLYEEKLLRAETPPCAQRFVDVTSACTPTLQTKDALEIVSPAGFVIRVPGRLESVVLGRVLGVG